VEPNDSWPLILVAVEDGGFQLTLTERDCSPQGMHRLASRLKTAMRHPAEVALVQPIEYTYGLPRRRRLEWLMTSVSDRNEDATFLAPVHRYADRPPKPPEFRASRPQTMARQSLCQRSSSERRHGKPCGA
jgi:hypothetical protein